jgi:hypothetical protein
MKGIGDHRSAVGPFPDHWFENDTDPDAGKEMTPDGFDDRMLAKLRALKESPPSGGSADGPLSDASRRQNSTRMLGGSMRVLLLT